MTQDPPSSRSAKKPLSNGAKVALGLGIGLLCTTVFGTASVVAVGLAIRQAVPDPAAPAVSTAEEATDGYTAATLVDELDGLYPLPDPRDETPACEPEGCVGAVATDPLTVYEMPDTAAAAAWADTLGATGGDARTAGRFVLFWPAESPQPLQDRDKLHTKAIVLVG